MCPAGGGVWGNNVTHPPEDNFWNSPYTTCMLAPQARTLCLWTNKTWDNVDKCSDEHNSLFGPIHHWNPAPFCDTPPRVRHGWHLASIVLPVNMPATIIILRKVEYIGVKFTPSSPNYKERHTTPAVHWRKVSSHLFDISFTRHGDGNQAMQISEQRQEISICCGCARSSGGIKTFQALAHPDRCSSWAAFQLNQMMVVT